MSFQIRWTLEAIESFNQNLEYLATDWGISVVNNFIDRVDESIELVARNPLIYPQHRKKERVHKCIINKRIILFFRIVDDSQIDLITFWNTYRNPDDLRV